jgi:hypothetical protein
MKETQWHLLVRFLHQQRPNYLPTHKLQSIDTDFGFIGSSGEQRVRELARHASCIPPELRNKVEKKRGSEIALDARYEYFRWKPQLSPIRQSIRMCELFDANAPAEQIFAA